MGLDGTIKRPDGQPLGSFAQVEGVLASLFPGVAFGLSLSGLEKLEAMESKGVTLPAVLREHLVSGPCEIRGRLHWSRFFD